MRRFRKGAEYVPDSIAFRPIDRNQRVRVIVAAEALERRTKGKGCKSGVLGASGLRILRCLLFDFCAVPSGLCCPSYEKIREKTGYCFATISKALKRLELSRLLIISRRIIRTRRGARATSNAYAFDEDPFGVRKPDYTQSNRSTKNLNKEGNQATLPLMMPKQIDQTLSAALRGLAEAMGIDPSNYPALRTPD